MKKKLIFILSGVVLLICCVCVTFVFIQKKYKYHNAVTLYESGKYKEAKEVFLELQDYKESAQYVDECIYGIKYASACTTYEKDIEGALTVFDELQQVGYKDSKEWLDKCRIVKVKKLLGQNQPYAAILLIEKLNSPSGYAEEIELCQKELGEKIRQLYKEGSFDYVIKYAEHLEGSEFYSNISDIIGNAREMEKLQGVWILDDDLEDEPYSTSFSGWTFQRRKLSRKKINTKYFLVSENVQEIEKEDIWLDKRLKKYKGCYINSSVRLEGSSLVSYDIVYRSPKQKKVIAILQQGSWIHEEKERKRTEQVEPQIGMTAQEVENSSWGMPQDKNITTYAWGTHEQWCYSGYRYIYFEDGYVTAISE